MKKISIIPNGWWWKKYFRKHRAMREMAEFMVNDIFQDIENRKKGEEFDRIVSEYMGIDFGHPEGDRTVVTCLDCHQSGDSKWGEKHDCKIAQKRSFIPCFYCKRYDSKVEKITSDGLNGHYHPHCAATVLHEAMAELMKRMSHAPKKR